MGLRGIAWDCVKSIEELVSHTTFLISDALIGNACQYLSGGALHRATQLIMPRGPNTVPQARAWCFTLNNYSSEELDVIIGVLSNDKLVKYGIVGKEVAPETGTPHLQGYVVFQIPRRFNWVKKTLNERCHLEIANGTHLQNRDYCRKRESGIERPSDFDARLNAWKEVGVPIETLCNTMFEHLMFKFDATRLEFELGVGSPGSDTDTSTSSPPSDDDDDDPLDVSSPPILGKRPKYVSE